MMNKYKIFFGDKMGCATLGYCEREGRDRDEEHRRYAEFLVKEGYTVLSCKGGTAMIAVNAGGIARNPPPDPDEMFPIRSMSRRAIAQDMSGVTTKDVAPDDRRLTPELCRELAAELGATEPENRGDIGWYQRLIARYARKAGFETLP